MQSVAFYVTFFYESVAFYTSYITYILGITNETEDYQGS